MYPTSPLTSPPPVPQPGVARQDGADERAGRRSAEHQQCREEGQAPGPDPAMLQGGGEVPVCHDEAW